MHLHDKHLEFEQLSRRLSRYNLLAIVVLFGMAGLGVILVSEFLYYAAPFVAAGIALSLVGLKKRAMRRFRELWNEKHGTPMSP